MMATYNGELYIREQINSILEQSYTNWKLFIRDDGSTDGTRDIISQYSVQYPEKVILVEDERCCHSAKLNFSTLYEVVEPADYYAFSDQDDIWEKEKLKKLVEMMESHRKKPTLIYHDLKLVDKNKYEIARSFFEYSGLFLKSECNIQQILMYNCVPGCTMLFNDELKRQIVEISPNCIMHDWWILLATICLQGNVIYCDEQLGLYRQHGNNEVGAVKQKPFVSILMKCFDVLRIRYYIQNNKKMYEERIKQTTALYEIFEEQISEEVKTILSCYVGILKSKRKFKNLYIAKKMGFVFNDPIYTCKFYVL